MPADAEMTRKITARLRAASRPFVSGHRVTCNVPYLRKPCACSKSDALRGVTCIRWGAYGVVGFSGVKDARRASPIAEACSRGGLLAGVQVEGANGGQKGCIWRAFW